MPAVAIRPALLPRQLLRLARRYADVDATVLITGETGVGKDALARYIHASGPRRHDPFVSVHCPALPSTLIESELFGHDRGAFTDARSARAGRFEQAARGTVYLDAIDGLCPSGQGALLRVLEDRVVTRLGATQSIDLRARVIASIGGEPEELIAAGIVRADLYHRLHVLPLRVPPLRERREAILPLVRHFIAASAASHRRPTPTLSAAARDALTRYHWPGNIREVRHVVERVLLVSTADCIDAASLPAHVLEGGDLYLPAIGRQRPTLAEVEQRYVALTLQLTRGNVTRAAAILGISRKGLWEKRKRFALE